MYALETTWYSLIRLHAFAWVLVYTWLLGITPPSSISKNRGRSWTESVRQQAYLDPELAQHTFLSAYDRDGPHRTFVKEVLTRFEKFRRDRMQPELDTFARLQGRKRSWETESRYDDLDATNAAVFRRVVSFLRETIERTRAPHVRSWTGRFVRWVERSLIPHWYLFTVDTPMEYTVQRPFDNPRTLVDAFDHVVKSVDAFETSVRTSLDQKKISRDVQSVILRHAQTNPSVRTM